MLLYDVTSEQSFVAVREWIEAVDVSVPSYVQSHIQTKEHKFYDIEFSSYIDKFNNVGCRRKTCSHNAMWE